jgi:hypothetical protein
MLNYFSRWWPSWIGNKIVYWGNKIICCGNKISFLWEQNNKLWEQYITVYWGNKIKKKSRMALISHRSFFLSVSQEKHTNITKIYMHTDKMLYLCENYLYNEGGDTYICRHVVEKYTTYLKILIQRDWIIR